MAVPGNTVIFRTNLVGNYIAHFEPILRGAGLKHAISIMEGLLLFGCGSIKAISDACIEKIDQSTMNRFINDTRWDPGRLNERRLQILQEHPQTCSVKVGVFIIDDSILEKIGRKIEGVSYHYSNSQKKSINGHNLVTSHYWDPKKDYPLHYILYRRKKELEENGESAHFKTRVEMAIELIDAAIDATINFEVAVFDTWYFAKQICRYLEQNGKDWVSRAKLNRVVNLPARKTNLKEWTRNLPDDYFLRLPEPFPLRDDVSGEEITYQYVHETILDLSDLGPIKCIVIKKELEDETGIILVSNRTDWEANKIITIYKIRWKIETFYRDSKQYLGLGTYQLRSIKGITRYWALVLLSYSFLQYCASLGILSSLLDDTISTTGDKLRRFQELHLKSLIDLIISSYEAAGDAKVVYQLILRGKYKKLRKYN